MVENQGDTEWLAQEVDESSFNDRRLGRRFRELMENFWKNIGSTIPFACQDWAGTKAAYRFLSNPHVDGDVLFSWQCYAPGEQFIHPIVRPVCYDVKHMTEVAFWIHAVQFARPDQTVQQCSSLSSVV